jgi:hypothetical protein
MDPHHSSRNEPIDRLRPGAENASQQEYEKSKLDEQLAAEDLRERAIQRLRDSLCKNITCSTPVCLITGCMKVESDGGQSRSYNDRIKRNLKGADTQHDESYNESGVMSACDGFVLKVISFLP